MLILLMDLLLILFLKSQGGSDRKKNEKYFQKTFIKNQKNKNSKIQKNKKY